MRSDYIKICDDKQITTLDGPPRIGKTHGGLAYFIKREISFISLTYRHSICKHQIECIRRIVEAEDIESLKVVYMVGMGRSCTNVDMGCGNCSLLKATYHEYTHNIYDEICWEGFQALTKEMVEEYRPDLCPYHFLLAACKDADGIITVPQLFSRVHNLGQVGLFVDEETVLRYFSPSSAQALSVRKTKGQIQFPDGGGVLHRALPCLIRLMKEIIEENKDGDEEDEDVELGDVDRIIVEAIDYLRELDEVLKIEKDDIDGLLSDWQDRLDQLSWVGDCGSDIRANAYETIQSYIPKVAEKEHPDINIAGLLQSVIWNRGYYFQRQKGSDRTKLFLIADEEHRFHLDKLMGFEKMVLVGGMEAEAFARDLDGEVQHIEIADFKYKGRFVVIPVKDKRRKLTRQREKVIEMLKRCEDDEIPALVLANSKKQASHVRRYKLDRRRTITDGGDREIDVRAYYESGLRVIFYQNSSVSRGLDLPFFKVIFVYGAGFSQPYYEWLSQLEEDDVPELSEEERKAEVEYGNEMLKYIYRLETTNSVLRITPTRTEDDGGINVIVIPDAYVDKLKYLETRVTSHPKPLWSHICRNELFSPNDSIFSAKNRVMGRNSSIQGRDGKEKHNITTFIKKYNPKYMSEPPVLPQISQERKNNHINGTEPPDRSKKQKEKDRSFSLRELEKKALREELSKSTKRHLQLYVTEIKDYLRSKGSASSSSLRIQIKIILDTRDEWEVNIFRNYLLTAGEIQRHREGRQILYEVS